MDPNNNSQRRGLNKKILIGVGIFLVMFIIIGVIGSISNKTEDGKKENGQSSQKSNDSLAKEVENKFLEQMGYKSLSEFQTDPNQPADSKRYINGFEDVSSGTVRVFVQTDVPKDEARSIGKNIMGLVGFDIKNLDWIVVRGTDGRDVNVSRDDIPALR